MPDDIRKNIVDAAIQLLELEGPKAFGQTRVAREAKVQQGHLTYYFPHKADLVAAVLERFTESSREEFARVMAGSEHLSPDEIRAVFFEHARGLVKDKRRTRLLLTLLIESIDDPELGRVLDERGLNQRAMTAVLLGRDPDDLDVDIVFSTLQGIGLQLIVRRGDPPRVDALIDRLHAWFVAMA